MKALLEFLINHFPDLLDLNLTASIVILFVICVRQFLKKAPKIFSYALWGIVLLRLLVPVSIESPMSFVPERTEFSSMVDINEALPEVSFETPQDRSDNRFHRENTAPGEPLVQVRRSLTASAYLTILWLLGIGIMVTVSALSYWKLRRRVRISIPLQKEIRIADDISTPFVMGLIRPVIYLPGTLEPYERGYIIAHERHHIRRGDHIFKSLAYAALTIHWFNPLVWVAYQLANRDMEMSCDEAVIRKLGEDVRADYAASLMNLATGQRIFSGIPLAFGEGDTTDRIRNLSVWKRPALWVILICMLLCILLAVCLLTDPETGIPGETTPISETSPDTVLPADAPPEADWGVSIVPDRVSRTGAIAAFSYGGSVPNEAGAELIYGEFLSLDVMRDGQWVSVPELPGYEYFVSDGTYPVADGYGMVHEWDARFGALPDGVYRLGKPVTLVRADGTTQTQMIYGQFSLPDSLLTGPIPLEDLPEYYGAEQAMIDGCLILRDGDAMDNIPAFREFAQECSRGEAGFFRIGNWYYGDDPHHIFFDLSYDGFVYTLSWLEDGMRKSADFQYMKHFTGPKEADTLPYDAYEYYVLVNDSSLDWRDIREDRTDSSFGGSIDHMVVFADYIYYPDLVEIPENLVRAELTYEDLELVTVTDPQALEGIRSLFADAEFLGFEPKTHSISIGLNLILTDETGQTITIELDPSDDIARICGEYISYGAPDEPSYIYKLWDYLGISAWPEFLYEACEHALSP